MFNDTKGLGLASVTHEYWVMSCIRYSAIDVPCTTEQAMKTLQRLQRVLGPHRKVVHSVNKLYWEIVGGKKQRKRANPPKNLLQFRRG